jgi:hypothetical protein
LPALWAVQSDRPQPPDAETFQQDRDFGVWNIDNLLRLGKPPVKKRIATATKSFRKQELTGPESFTWLPILR